jgi:hypothetical protein
VPQSATALAQRARQGQADHVLPALLAIAQTVDADPEQARLAASSAIPILFWHDRFVEAADLAEWILSQVTKVNANPPDRGYPFDAALLAAHLHAGIPALSRLRQAAAQLPAGKAMSTRFTWLADALSGKPVEALLPGPHPWGEPAAPVLPAAANLLNHDYERLTQQQRRILWTGLTTANRYDAAREIYAESQQAPPVWDSAIWLAGWLAVDGDADAAARLLIRARPVWRADKTWEPLPATPVLQPVLRSVLRSVVTALVRQHYLTQPADTSTEEGGS